MKKLSIIGILLAILVISYLILCPGPNENLYQENRVLFDYDQDSPLEIQIIAEKQAIGTPYQIDLTYVSPAGGLVPATIFFQMERDHSRQS